MKELEKSLQDTFAPRSVCFGCGPANRRGFKIKSFVLGDYVVADWKPKWYHHAFKDYVSGGVLSILLDCHSNWSAAYYIMKRLGLDSIPPTVTAKYTVEFLKPTPMEDYNFLSKVKNVFAFKFTKPKQEDTKLHLVARALNVYDNKAEIQTEVQVNGVVTARATGIFVAVKSGHPAYDRWL